jgi:hypothetical protein
MPLTFRILLNLYFQSFLFLVFYNNDAKLLFSEKIIDFCLGQMLLNGVFIVCKLGC